MRKGIWRVDRSLWIMVASVVWELWRQEVRMMAWLPAVAAVIMHEVAHVWAARMCGVGIRQVHLTLTGARLELEGCFSYGKEWLIAAAGPTANLLSVALLLSVRRMEVADGTLVFATSSLVLGALNLLPIATLDGGRMLFCGLARWMNIHIAEGVVRVVTGICLGMLWLVAGYLLLRTGEMLTLWIFATCLLLNDATRK